MKLVYETYDSKSGLYSEHRFFNTDGEAIRAFQTAAMQEGTDFHNWAADFTLFKVGTFDNLTGDFDGHEKINMGTALHWRTAAENDRTLQAVPDQEEETG